MSGFNLHSSFAQLGSARVRLRSIRRGFAVRVAVVGLGIGGDLFRGTIRERVEEQLASGVIDDGCLAFREARVGESHLLPLRVREGLHVRDRAFVHVEVGDVKRAAGELVFEAGLIFETDLRFSPFKRRKNTR
jgi:hypothetical protein